MTLPLFKSHYSIGRSILTLEEAETSKENGPKSIIDICLENGIKELFLAEDSMSGFLQAYENCDKSKIKLIFGVRMTFCNDTEIKTTESISEESKYIIFAKNTEGYRRLIKIYSEAATDGFYYIPRYDFEKLKKHWSNEDLMLCVPFYDSFLFKNLLGGNECVTDFSFCEPTFFLEENNLPFDPLIRKYVDQFCESGHESIETQTIYYEKKQDFKDYLTFRCLSKRTTLEKPNLDHMCSNEFCVESWKNNSMPRVGTVEKVKSPR